MGCAVASRAPMRLELVTLSAGPLLMGSERGQADEQPDHEVWLDEFALAVVPVTNRAYERYQRSPVENPRGPETSSRRTSRGGSWRHRIPFTPCAARSSVPPDRTYADYGFRVAVGGVGELHHRPRELDVAREKR